MRRIQLLTLTAVALACAHVVPTGPAHAQNAMDPFGAPETSRPASRKLPEAAAPGKPLLEPMDGHLPEAGEKTGSVPAPYGAGQDQTGPTPYPADPSPASAFERPDRQAIMREPLPSAPFDEKSRAVQRDELAPITTGNEPALAGQPSNHLSSELSSELWRGLTAGADDSLAHTSMGRASR